ncbi:MAG: asparagine synthase C-terminal domain-containing protein [Candidatus Methanoplasma sp.]|jgi:asparagine synthase (glutamine-hydrolysing)|nr:asparagine synthase C-terminal domain-containing protein [Candidatus Methanoplasma sp.]
MSEQSDAVGALIEGAVERGVRGKEVAVAFSGGLDSGLVAALAGRHSAKATLYTVGSEDSYDVRMARNMLPHLGLEWNHIPLDEEIVESSIREMIQITGTVNALTVSFELPGFCVCRACREDIVIGGQGSDEIFLGYSKYVGLDDDSLRTASADDLAKLRGPVMVHETKTADNFGKTVLYPFLDDALLSYLQSLDIGMLRPINEGSRKNLLREAAASLGFGFVTDCRKKAAQYGSGTMDIVRRICKDRHMTFSELVETIASEEAV